MRYLSRHAPFVVAIAAAAVGCLLGFLFGIPRSLQRGPQILSIQTTTQPDAPMATGNDRTTGPNDAEQNTSTESAPTGEPTSWVSSTLALPSFPPIRRHPPRSARARFFEGVLLT
jgi:hypothetical protein